MKYLSVSMATLLVLIIAGCSKEGRPLIKEVTVAPDKQNTQRLLIMAQSPTLPGG